jgi:hypothetical protein
MIGLKISLCIFTKVSCEKKSRTWCGEKIVANQAKEIPRNSRLWFDMNIAIIAMAMTRND